MNRAPIKGRVITVRGPVDPRVLGKVMMHEHLHSDIYDWKANRLIAEERPAADERREYLLGHAVPLLRQCRNHDCRAYVDPTPAPWRAWPDLYREVAEAAGIYIVLCTGFYREVELNTYWVRSREEQIWPFVREASIEQLSEHCVREIRDGAHGTEIHAGAIKLGSSQPQLTEAEEKALRAGARAQKATGVHITTHCTQIGVETSQLEVLDEEGVDLNRVVIGHVAKHLMDPDCRKVCLDWMRRGANFLPTNLGIRDEDCGERWRPLVEAIHEVFDSGLGDRLCLGLDCGYCSESKEFGPMTFLPPEPFLHLFTHTLPAFREMGLTPEEEEPMMRTNPARILPVQ